MFLVCMQSLGKKGIGSSALRERESYAAQARSRAHRVRVFHHRILQDPIRIERLQLADGHVYLPVDVHVLDGHAVPSPPKGLVGDPLWVHFYVFSTAGVGLIRLPYLLRILVQTAHGVENMPGCDHPPFAIEHYEGCAAGYHRTVQGPVGYDHRSCEFHRFLDGVGEH